MGIWVDEPTSDTPSNAPLVPQTIPPGGATMTSSAEGIGKLLPYATRLYSIRKMDGLFELDRFRQFYGGVLAELGEHRLRNRGIGGYHGDGFEGLARTHRMVAPAEGKVGD